MSRRRIFFWNLLTRLTPMNPPYPVIVNWLRHHGYPENVIPNFSDPRALLSFTYRYWKMKVKWNLERSIPEELRDQLDIIVDYHCGTFESFVSALETLLFQLIDMHYPE